MTDTNETGELALAMKPRQLSVGWQVLGLMGWLALCFAALAVSSSFTIPEINGWYGTLEKPSFNPPNWIFGPVWSFLFLLMAVSAWLVWRRYGFARSRAAMTIFFVQLIANMLWSLLFFRFHSPSIAFLWICVLWSLIVSTIMLFWRKSPLAGGLLIPYLAWVTLAGVLNFWIWRLNLS